MQASFIFVQKNLKINISETKNIVKLEITVIMQKITDVLRIVYVIL